MDRLRRRLGVVLARALRSARRRRRNRWDGHRDRGQGSERRDRALGHVPAQAGGDAVGPRRSGADGQARRLALRLRRRGLGLPDAADRAERAVGSLASDPAHADRGAVPGERPALRHALAGARWTAGAPRLERAVHGRRRCGVVESGRLGLRPRARELRQRESHLARRPDRRLASTSYPAPPVGREAPRGRDPTLADRDHDRLPDRGGLGRTRRVEAAVALVQRRQVAHARREAGREGARPRTRLVLGLGTAQRAVERSRQDVRRLRVALGARREPVRRADRSRTTSSMRTRRSGSSVSQPACAASMGPRS